MKIAVLGGGFTGLTAAYYLAKKGHSVILFEKEAYLGGLAAGFKAHGWEWFLERAYHHLFSNDNDMLGLAEEIGFDNIFFQEPETASLYQNYKSNIKHQTFITLPIDTPQDFLRFPFLSIPQKLRTGLVIACLRSLPFFSFLERQTAEKFLRNTMGKEVWNVLWRELFRKKFGKYAGNILASFFWARIKKRTKALGYIRGGFQAFVDALDEKNKAMGVIVRKQCGVDAVLKKHTAFAVLFHNTQEIFDSVILTLPTPVCANITANLFPSYYLSQLRRIQYLDAINLILATQEPFLEKTYWLNINAQKLFPMVIIQHTNFIDKKYYNNNHILYVGNYVERSSPLLKISDENVCKYYLQHLKKIHPDKMLSISSSSVFRAPFAQPIFDAEFLKNKPEFETPIHHVYMANLDMTYPYDRGTNYAVFVGKTVAQLLTHSTFF